MKILNFGSLNIDYVYQVNHMVREGETQSTGGMEIFLGGKGFNQSVALAKAGVEVYHAGMIGEDGHEFISTCQEYNIHTEYIKTIGGKTGHTIIQVDKNAQNSILLYGGCNHKIGKNFIDKVMADFNKGDCILLQNEISNLQYIIDCAYEKGMTIFLNPSPFNNELMKCDMSKISYFILNDIEGEQLTGETIPDKIIRKIHLMYTESKIVLTLGKEGAIYGGKNVLYHQAARKVKAIDTTAAGDTFTGYFIAGIVKGDEIEKIMNFSTLAASIAVSSKGASPSIPMSKEVEAMALQIKEN